MSTVIDDRLYELFKELVPANGKAESKAGEIVRAVTRIEYRYFNDGDQIGEGYGKETCNPAARYLLNEANGVIAEIIEKMWGACGGYEDYLEILKVAALDYIDNNPQLKEMETADMWDYTDADEDRDDVWDYADEEEW